MRTKLNSHEFQLREGGAKLQGIMGTWLLTLGGQFDSLSHVPASSILF
jgi:hypothetical protein